MIIDEAEYHFHKTLVENMLSLYKGKSVKANIVHNRVRYNNSTQFYRDYFGSDIERLMEVIKKYKQTHGTHKKGEEYLADLLK